MEYMMATETKTKRPYTEPAIIFDLELETKAGSPLGMPDPLGDPGLED